MTDNYISNKVFSDVDFTINRLPIGEYDQCTFANCNFAKSDISNCVFLESNFIDCNLALTKTKNTRFQEIQFTNCKLLGVPFNECDTFLLAFNFENCNLNLSSFYQLKLIGIKFKNCTLHEVDFVEGNFTNAVFDNCELNNAIFKNSNLMNCNFITAINFNIDPGTSKLKGASFSRNEISGLLLKHQIIIV